jgi:hypothetical protein
VKIREMETRMRKDKMKTQVRMKQDWSKRGMLDRHETEVNQRKTHETLSIKKGRN